MGLKLMKDGCVCVKQTSVAGFVESASSSSSFESFQLKKIAGILQHWLRLSEGSQEGYRHLFPPLLRTHVMV